MLQNGVDVRTVQEVLGHEQPEHDSDIRTWIILSCTLPQRPIPYPATCRISRDFQLFIQNLWTIFENISEYISSFGIA